MAFFSKKRKVPTPAEPIRHQSANPIFQSEEQAVYHQFRTTVLRATGFVLLAILIGAWLYGPWFRITEIQVSGTRLIVPSTVQSAAQRYIDRQRWLILPNRNMMVLSKKGLARDLTDRIRKRISIEGIDIVKTYRHTVRVLVRERTPVLLWSSGETKGTVDRSGVVIEIPPSTDASTLVSVRDEAKLPMPVDASVVKQEVVSKLVELAGNMASAHIEVETYLVPQPTCPIPVIPVPDVNANINISVNNTNTSVLNANLNHTATITNVANGNFGIPDTSNIIPCDPEALRRDSQELHVQLVKGPVVYFDRHENLSHAVQTLKELLGNADNMRASYIDLRFEERAYIKQ